ncbi:hypothetical protein CONCODRAFT_11509 [Conidiobolus coronatus NRRL 28638]|uniref:Cytochrome P450 n=1 Tax=Conidiobolus coronatus (strain ATCC 28846 / CBS 209.66 / NRRL 28638) TaxID=796925 RepID=A0A137NUW5_CONC2|nr:hypothetical protein CONCODRAFT_11509 [Conidiobolus coronatus NRRL 28638]|eukprot:KXN66603.1 hypothetical protein CONCODRAFT_11509 [Conidiobolus coronatus NRRL 28638]
MNPEAYKSIQIETDIIFPNRDMPLCPETCRTMMPITKDLKSQIMIFSQGPRGCLGRALTWMEIFFIITVMAQRYNFKLCPGQEKLGNKPAIYFMMKSSTCSIKVEIVHRERLNFLTLSHLLTKSIY